MKTMHIGEFKAHFSEVVEWVKNGSIIKVIKGKNEEVVGYFGKQALGIKKPKRVLGSLSNLKINIKKKDIAWSEEELKELGL